MRRRMRSAATTAALLLSLCTFGLVGSGTAAAAAEPIIVGSCQATVQGKPGQSVALAPAAVLGVVTDAVRAVPLLGPPLAGAANKAFAALPPIPIGALPTGTGYLTGGDIANAVVAELTRIPLLGPVLGAVVNIVRGTLSSVCQIVVTGTNAVTAPVQDGAAAVADTSEEVTKKLLPGNTGPGPGAPGGETPGNPDTGGTPSTGGGLTPNQPPVGGLDAGDWSLYPQGLTGLARSPLDLYGSVPFAYAGQFAPAPGVRYGGAVPGYSPQFGILGAENPDDGVQAAGRAEALAPPNGQRIELPVLLAVLALSVVTAALVRTWVLRRAPAATA
ncbi:hypothetical protein [Actinophytocola sediminis]